MTQNSVETNPYHIITALAEVPGQHKYRAITRLQQLVPENVAHILAVELLQLKDLPKNYPLWHPKTNGRKAQYHQYNPGAEEATEREAIEEEIPLDISSFIKTVMLNFVLKNLQDAAARRMLAISLAPNQEKLKTLRKERISILDTIQTVLFIITAENLTQSRKAELVAMPVRQELQLA